MANTKQRHLAILAKAHEILDEQQIDVTEPASILPLAKMLAVATDCHITTAKRHISQAVRQKRGQLAGLWEEESGTEWGGLRHPAGGRPPKETAEITSEGSLMTNQTKPL